MDHFFFTTIFSVYSWITLPKNFLSSIYFSAGITFCESCSNATEVTVYAKLPKSFYVTTPIANYSPDWAIVFDKEKVRHIYFIAETKGSESDLELREIEKLKLHCAKKHFHEISGQQVHFAKVSSYESLLNIVGFQ